ncbi:hypothetical protein HDU90_008690 [Geranomyces variabilis]|nr:hypothetical protein HDU90_008690 [Geranomyces variabilis]
MDIENSQRWESDLEKIQRAAKVIRPTDIFAKLVTNATLGHIYFVLDEEEVKQFFSEYVLTLDQEALVALVTIAKASCKPEPKECHQPEEVHQPEEAHQPKEPDESQSTIYDSDLEQSESESLPVWDGAFVMDKKWREEFFARTLIDRDGKPYATDRRYDANVWIRLGERPFDNVDSTFQTLLAFHNEKHNKFGTIRKDLDKVKMFLTNMTPEEKVKLVQDPEFPIKLDLLYEEVKSQEDEQTILKNQEATEDEKAAAMRVETIVEKTLKYRNELFKDGEPSREDLEACAHVLCQVVENEGAPRRRYDYLNMIKGTSQTSNTYDPNTGLITLLEYKTSNAYGVHTLTVSQTSKRILDALAAQTDEGCHLFSLAGKDLTALTKSQFQKVVGKPIYSTLLRYIYITWRQENGTLTYQRERAHLANLMGNSILLQQTAYTKRNLFQLWDAEAGNAAHTQESANETDAVEEGTTVIIGAKRKPRREFEPEENEQLEELWPKHNGDVEKIRDEAIDRAMLLSRRPRDSLKKHAQRVAAKRIKLNQPLGGFEGINLNEHMVKEFRLE